MFARGPPGDDDQVENEEAFPRVDNESFIQRLLLEGDQLDSLGSARFLSLNTHGLAQS